MTIRCLTFGNNLADLANIFSRKAAKPQCRGEISLHSIYRFQRLDSKNLQEKFCSFERIKICEIREISEKYSPNM